MNVSHRLSRPRHVSNITALLSRFPVVAVIGARQVGKTTLAREIAKSFNGPVHFFDMEDPVDQVRMSEPSLALRGLTGLVVIDEIQRMPGLFPILRVLADRDGPPARFLILGSASPGLIRQSSESLAGRIFYYELTGFTMDETGTDGLGRLWLRGGFPRAFLAESNKESLQWLRSFIATFLERDIPQLGIHVPAATLRRFWTMVAHYHGQVMNFSEFGRAFGLADTTIRRYLDIMSSTFVVRVLQPWHANIKKRQVKAPKVYVADSGMLHALLDIHDMNHLNGHPKVGASWEGFAITQIKAVTQARWDQCFFWRTHGGAELDLLIVHGNQYYGFEIKHTDTPVLTPSMRSAIKDLNLGHLYVIHAGEHVFPLTENVTAMPLTRLNEVIDPL